MSNGVVHFNDCVAVIHAASYKKLYQSRIPHTDFRYNSLTLGELQLNLGNTAPSYSTTASRIASSNSGNDGVLFYSNNV
jgi:hypothetical protein